jgi:hypothetical protein
VLEHVFIPLLKHEISSLIPVGIEPVFQKVPDQLTFSNEPFYIHSILSICVGSAKLRCENNLGPE